MQRTDYRLQNVDENKQSDPDGIHEVPIPSGTFKSKVLIGLEMPAQTSDKNDGQRNRTNSNVETMESRQHEEGRSIYP